jgi:hypothetical protein
MASSLLAYSALIEFDADRIEISSAMEYSSGAYAASFSLGITVIRKQYPPNVLDWWRRYLGSQCNQHRSAEETSFPVFWRSPPSAAYAALSSQQFQHQRSSAGSRMAWSSSSAPTVFNEGEWTQYSESWSMSNAELAHMCSVFGAPGGGTSPAVLGDGPGQTEVQLGIMGGAADYVGQLPQAPAHVAVDTSYGAPCYVVPLRRRAPGVLGVPKASSSSPESDEAEPGRRTGGDQKAEVAHRTKADERATGRHIGGKEKVQASGRIASIEPAKRGTPAAKKATPPRESPQPGGQGAGAPAAKKSSPPKEPPQTGQKKEQVNSPTCIRWKMLKHRVRHTILPAPSLPFSFPMPHSTSFLSSDTSFSSEERRMSTILTDICPVSSATAKGHAADVAS